MIQTDHLKAETLKAYSLGAVLLVGQVERDENEGFVLNARVFCESSPFIPDKYPIFTVFS